MNGRNKSFLGITFDRHISIGNIFTIIVVIASGAIAYANIQHRLYNLEQEDIRLFRVQQRMDTQMEINRQERLVAFEKIDQELDKIHDKLESKVDK